MGSKTDPDYLFKLEKAIEEKYGKEAIVSLKSNWTKEAENLYQKGLKTIAEKMKEESVFEKDEGFIFRKVKDVKEQRICKDCGAYSVTNWDNLYLNKYGICAKCFFEKRQVKEVMGTLKVQNDKKPPN